MKHRVESKDQKIDLLLLIIHMCVYLDTYIHIHVMKSIYFGTAPVLMYGWHKHLEEYNDCVKGGLI